MSDRTHRALPQLVVFALGVWLMAAPAVLGYAEVSAGSSDRLIGPTVGAIGFLAASEILRSLRWLNLAAAAYLIVAPWVLGFPAAAVANDVVVGLLLVGLSPLGRADPGRFGGGWRALSRP